MTGEAPPCSRPLATLLLEHIGELVTLEPSLGDGPLGLLSDATIAIGGDRIIWAGPASDLTAHVELNASTKRIEVGPYVVTPGLIDCHTHLVFAGSREAELEMRIAGASYQQIGAAGGGILSTVRATRAASREALFALGQERLKAALSFGVTTCEIKSGYGLTLDDELKILKTVRDLSRAQPVRLVPTLLGAHTVPLEHRPHRRRYVDCVVQEMIPAAAEEKLARFCDVFCEEGAFTLEESREILTAAKDAGLGIKIHAEQLSAYGGAQLAGELGATSADHLEHIDEAGISALLEAGTVAVLLPGATLFLNQAFPDMRRLLEASVPLAIATDFNPGSCPSQNLLLMGTLAGIRMRLPLPVVMKALTVDAARALKLEQDVGKLVPGMRADLAIFAVPSYRHLFYHYGTNPCHQVIKSGQIVYSVG